MSRFEIIQTISGARLGVYEGATGKDAIRAMLADAGDSGEPDAGLRAVPVVVVPADEESEDCLTDAADTYIAKHPGLLGYDLRPRWTDGDRDTVTLTVPSWHQESQ